MEKVLRNMFTVTLRHSFHFEMNHVYFWFAFHFFKFYYYHAWNWEVFADKHEILLATMAFS